MYPKFVKQKTFFIVGCTFANKCSEIKVELYKITCVDSVMTADAAPILKSVTAEAVGSVTQAEYENSFSSSILKCPVVKFGLLE
jgi:hypothetical protein